VLPAATSRRITANSVLPATRIPLSLHTVDGLRLVGEAALPDARPLNGVIVCAHPLPTHGGMMDSHLLRKAAWRLPALAGIGVVRFNTRGTASVAGHSEGAFDEARGEGLDLAAAVGWVRDQGLPPPWLVGWSFGTDVVLKHGLLPGLPGALLLSPPLKYTSEPELAAWASDGRRLVAMVPELDDYLRPVEAERRFRVVPQAEVVAVPGAKHLWVGEPSVRRVLAEVVALVAPQVELPLPTEWSGPMAYYRDLPSPD
jgi:alpha/beta superfamily hydrolase